MDDLKLGFIAGAVLSAFIAWCLHVIDVQDIEIEYKDQVLAANARTNALSKKLSESEHALDEKHQKELAVMRDRYDDLNAQLERLRVENATLKRDSRSSASSQCEARSEQQQELLLRMANLGVRTSKACDAKQAALNNCVANYDRIADR